MAPKISPIRKR